MEMIEELANDGWKVNIRHNTHEYVLTISRASKYPGPPDESFTYKGHDLRALVAIAHGGAPEGAY
jgi:hypothetical protein